MDRVTKLDHKIAFPPICHSYFGNSKWPFTVLSISRFCGIGLSVIRSRLRKALSIFSISPLSHLPFPLNPLQLSFQLSPSQQNSSYRGHQLLHLTRLPKVISSSHCISLLRSIYKKSRRPLEFMGIGPGPVADPKSASAQVSCIKQCSICNIHNPPEGLSHFCLYSLTLGKGYINCCYAMLLRGQGQDSLSFCSRVTMYFQIF